MSASRRSSLSQYLLADQVRGEVHHDRRLHVLMLREEEMQWERGLSKPQYHTRWNSMLGEVHSSPTDSAGSLISGRSSGQLFCPHVTRLPIHSALNILLGASELLYCALELLAVVPSVFELIMPNVHSQFSSDVVQVIHL